MLVPWERNKQQQGRAKATKREIREWPGKQASYSGWLQEADDSNYMKKKKHPTTLHTTGNKYSLHLLLV